MKSATICVLLAILGLSAAASNSYPRGCIYSNGKCVQECPVGTLSYSIGCGYVTREATCRNSRPKPDKYQTCDYSACHCVRPTVRDEKSGQCVHLDKCPGAKIIYTHGHGGVPKVQIRPVPHKPAAPQVPVAPRVPVAPQAPVAPRVPVAPQVPVVPRVPVAPQVPVAPVEPSVPTYTGYNNANTGYKNYNTGYNQASNGYNGNNRYPNTNSGYTNYNSGYTNTNSGAPQVGYY